jgi:hypothetical protein
MRGIAKRRGGTCISRRYVDSRTPLRWRCRFGHLWKAIPTNVTQGSWCPDCAHRRRLTLREMQAIAADRGGQCLAKQYVNNETKLLWRCSASHQWAAAPGLVKSGGWCPYCAHVARLSLNEMHVIATLRKGRCVSTEYISIKTPLLWRCQSGHQWKASPASIKRGSWCPVCARSQRLKLDEMCRLAAERGGRCLSNTYLNNHTRLLWECKQGHRWRAMACNVKDRVRKRGTWCLQCYNLRRRFRSRGTLERLKAVAFSRGGACLSKEYVNSKAKVRWRCDQLHEWRATPDTVVQGSWCPVCARNRRLTLKELRALAIRNGGRCLSRKYVNKQTALRWRCERGHRWSAPPGRIRQGAWCRTCANERRRSPWKSREHATCDVRHER